MPKRISGMFIGLLLLTGTMLFASPVFAIPCFNEATGVWEEVDSVSDCSGSNQTLDPGASSFDDATDGSGDITTFGGLLARFRSILDTIVPFLVALGVFVIIYGVFTYIRHSADEEKRDEAKKFIVWGVVGVFIMVSIWGFVNILINTVPLKKTPVQVESVFPTGLYE